MREKIALDGVIEQAKKEEQQALAIASQQGYETGFRKGEDKERERMEKQFIWGQVKALTEDGWVEWTMHCISDEDWQTLREKDESLGEMPPYNRE